MPLTAQLLLRTREPSPTIQPFPIPHRLFANLQPTARNISANAGKGGDQQQRAVDTLVAATRGQHCFDAAYYRTHNPDLAAIKRDNMVFKHFLAIGMMEYREHRYEQALHPPRT